MSWAVCVLNGKEVSGTIWFQETENGTEIRGEILGLNPGFLFFRKK